MWVFLWLVLSAILIGATLWSLQILIRQKKAWSAFAKAKNLTYTPGTFMGPAEMTGMISDYKVSFFTAERQSLDMRSRRFVTVLEMELGEGLVDGGVAGTQEMLTFMQTLTQIHRYKVEAECWQNNYHMFVRNDDVIAAYLTPERIENLCAILKFRNADVLIVFNDKETVLRLETSDPMQDADKIDKIVTKLIAQMNKLRISKEERRSYMALADAAT